jgi:hypothetical protein
LNLNPGAVFDMTDGSVGIFNLNQQSGFTGTALTLNNAILNFDLSNVGADSIVVNRGSAVVSGSNVININGIGSSLTSGGNYTIISAPSGLNGNFVFSSGGTSEAFTVGSTHYKLTLNSSGTAETIHVYGPTSYQLTATVANPTIITGGSTTVSSAIQNTGTLNNNVALDYTGLSVGVSGVGSVSTLSQSGLGLSPTNSASGTCTFTSSVPGTATITPSVGSVTNNMIGGSASGGSLTTATLTVLGHSAPSLSVGTGNTQTVIVGATGITAGLSLSNGTLNQSGLASLDVNSLGTGVSGSTGYKLVASGSMQSYTAALNTGTLGTQVETFSLNAGDDHTLSGASSATNTSTGVTLTVLDHSNASLSSTANQTSQTINFGNVLRGATIPSQSFTIYNRAANTTAANTSNLKLTGFTASGDSALTTTISPFGGLSAGGYVGYTASLNTTNYTQTGINTVTMSASQLADDSTLPGAGNNNNGGITVTLEGNVGNATADKSNSQSSFGTALTAPVAQNASYVNLESTATATTGSGGCGMVGSTATILAGTNGSGSAETVSMAWRTQTQTERTSPALISDIVQLSGMAFNGDQTSPFVLQMTFNPALLPGGAGNEGLWAADERIYLGWLNPSDGKWENAVLGNFGSNNDNFVGVGAWNGDMTLGDWGVNTSNDTVWAVVNHNSEYAAVPEPSTLVLLGTCAIWLFGWAWRRKAMA